MAVRDGGRLVAASVLAGALLVFGAGAALPAFRDLEGHWARSAIMALTTRGVVNGFPDGTFQPFAPVTRAQTATLLAQVFSAPREVQRLAAERSRFADLTGHWAAGYVEAAAERSLIFGYEDNSYRPEQPMRRVEAVSLVVRAAGLAGRARQFPADARLPYPDADAVPGWAFGDVWIATREGLLRDVFPGLLQPERPINRAELAALMARLMAYRGGLHHVVGTVQSWDEAGGVLRLRTTGGVLHALTVPRDALVFRSGTPIRQFRPLDQVWAVLGRDGAALYVETRYADVTGFNPQVSERTLTLIENGSWARRTVVVPPTARVFLNGRPAEVSDLAGAQRVYAVLDVNSGEARIVDAVRYTHSGTLVGISGPTEQLVLTLRLGTGQRVALPLAPEVIAFDRGVRIVPQKLTLGLSLLVDAPDAGPVGYLEVIR